MKWSFHKRRKDRYYIAIQQLKETFKENKGWDLLVELRLIGKENLSLEEDQLIYHLEHLVDCLSLPRNKAQKAHIRFNKLVRKMHQKVQMLDIKQEWHEKLKHLVLELCVTKYHRMHFYSYGASLLEEMFSSLTLSDKKFDFETHFQNYGFKEEALLIENSMPLLHLERDLRKLDEYYLKRHFDSHRYNLPFLLYTLAFFRKGQLKRIKMVRMGCPTKESWFKKPQVICEFKGFLHKLNTLGKQHLYINKQKTWGEEGRRSEKVKALENEFSNFFCVCLPSDGDFYHQKGRFQNVSRAGEFKNLFDRMLREKVNSGYYHLPKSWREDLEFCVQLKDVIDQVHSLYFEGKETLSAHERHLFIDIAYTHLILFFMEYAPIDSMNITCRDGIDRAGCEQTKLLYYLQISRGIEENIESKKYRQYVQHVPVYLAKNRPIVAERREILHNVLQLISPEVKQQIYNQHQKKPLIFSDPHFVKSTQGAS